MTQTNTPIYHQVCEDLNVFPLAMKQRSHVQFMRDQKQTEWLAAAQHRAYSNVVPAPVRLVRPGRKPRRPR